MAFMLCMLIIAPASAATITYSYDTAGQISRAAYSSASIEYTYDNSGNRTSQTITQLIPEIAVSPAALSFSNTSLGSSHHLRP